MFGRKPKITLFEKEEIIGSFKILPNKLGIGVLFMLGGNMYITNQRIVCEISEYNLHHSMVHDSIISFNFGMSIPIEGTRFTVLYEHINDFGSINYLTVELKVREKKKIEKLLQAYSYYEKPHIIPDSVQSNTTKEISSQDDPLKILKTRYVKGEITKEEFDEMKKDLE